MLLHRSLIKVRLLKEQWIWRANTLAFWTLANRDGMPLDGRTALPARTIRSMSSWGTRNA